jgi:hypothetical protein
MADQLAILGILLLATIGGFQVVGMVWEAAMCWIQGE